MKLTIHRQPEEVEAIVTKNDVDKYIEEHVYPGEYFSVGNMYPDGWYEREYRKG